MNLPSRPIRQFYPTIPVRCPYLPQGEERKLVVDLAVPEADRFYADLSRSGFRRSHSLAYRPACRGCRACVAVRIRVADFTPSRSLKRVLKANRDLLPGLRPPCATSEQYRLFRRYQHGRHGGGEMATMSFAEYRALVEETPVDTFMLESRNAAGVLVAAMIADRIEEGLSAMYSFFEPGEPRRSLGTNAVLGLVALARAEGRPFVYLGYWIEGSATMAYKRRFPALEALVDGRWMRL